MHSVIYWEIIRKRGWLGIPYAVPKPRVAHLDERHWQRLRGRPFSVGAMLRLSLARD